MCNHKTLGNRLKDSIVEICEKAGRQAAPSLLVLLLLGYVNIQATAMGDGHFAALQKQQRVTDRPANKMGRVYIVMYHHFRKGKGDMFRTPAQFKADLEQYYKLGFRPVLASEYIQNKMPLPPGASPIVLTFDDSNADQLQIKKDGSVTSNCAVGIWMDFAKTHPDFPVHGTFFVLPDSLWGPARQVPKKLAILKSLGSEVGNHTITHPFLNRLSDNRVKWEIGRCSERLAALGIKPPDLFAVPYGVMPRNRSLLKGFNWKHGHVPILAAFRADGNPARSPEDPKFTKFNVPRIVAGYKSDSMQAFLKRMARGEFPPYVEP